MEYKRPQKTPLEIRETNREKILKALEEQRELTFSELLNLQIVSRGALNLHLKALLKKQDIEKRYSKTKDKIVYCLTNRSESKLYVESEIQALGLIGITYIARRKLNKPIADKYKFLEGIEQLIIEKPKYLSWKEILRFLEKDYWAKVDLTKPK